MRSDGWQVSLLYRRHVPASQQSPRTAALAAQLGIVPFDESELDSGCLIGLLGETTNYLDITFLTRLGYDIPKLG